MTSFNTSLSGFSATNTLLNVAAYKVANMFSGDYGAQDTNGQQIDAATIDRQPNLAMLTGASSAITDLTADVVHTIQSKEMYTASATITRAADQMLGKLLDVTSKD